MSLQLSSAELFLPRALQQPILMIWASAYGGGIAVGSHSHHNSGTGGTGTASCATTGTTTSCGAAPTTACDGCAW